MSGKDTATDRKWPDTVHCLHVDVRGEDDYLTTQRTDWQEEDTDPLEVLDHREYVRVDLLEQLAEQFRGRANFAEKAAGNETAAEVARQNADEIERLIEDAR